MVTVRVLPDSGASTTVVPHSLIKKLNIPIDKSYVNEVELTNASRQTMKVEGKVVFLLTCPVSETSRWVRGIASSSITGPILLGWEESYRFGYLTDKMMGRPVTVGTVNKVKAHNAATSLPDKSSITDSEIKPTKYQVQEEVEYIPKVPNIPKVPKQHDVDELMDKMT